MTYSINESMCEKYGVDLPTVLIGMLLLQEVNVEDLLHKLEEQDLIRKNLLESKYMVSVGLCSKIHKVLLDSDKTLPSASAIDKLSERLIALYPKGYKPGTKTPWRSNVRDITLRLQKFFKLYGNYPLEEVYEATKRYVDSFSEDKTLMQVLRYFIWKNPRKLNADGDLYVEEQSKLADFLNDKNLGQTEEDVFADLK